MDVFETTGDREAYLRFLGAACARHGLAIQAYCLMTNHIHLVAVPRSEYSLGKALHDAHTAYALYFNGRTMQSGHLWQGRFKSCVLDDEHLWNAVRYVELNPVRARMSPRAYEYPWSSAAAHCGIRSDPLLDAAFPPPGVIEDWDQWLHAGALDDTACDRLRLHTRTGRPCGSHTFIDRLEETLGRVLRPKPGGRPRKNENP
jgi:putative transposase